MTHFPRFAVLLATLLSSGCSSTGDESTDPTPADTDAIDSDTEVTLGDPSILAGAFEVTLVDPIPASDESDGEPGRITVLGKVYDGAYPDSIIWVEAAHDGDCRLLTPRVPFCETPCGGDAVCVEDDTCAPYPHVQGVGSAELRLPDDGDTRIDLVDVGGAYQLGAAGSLAYPPFAEGNAVQIEAAGSAFTPGFLLEGAGIGPLRGVSEDVVLDGHPVELGWDPPSPSATSAIRVQLDVSHHAGSKGMITCATDDDGALELSASLVRGLLDLGVAGFPTIVVTRHSGGQALVTSGRVELGISSTVEVPVSVPGVVSCTDTTQCPDGQSCHDDLTCY